MFISKLKMLGFKSFADDTSVPIDAGLNGIIGPNGSGKSNIVEAIKWVMGESSSKSLRASGMNDLIFNGSATKPSRNIASATLQIEVNKESISKNNRKYVESGFIEVERQLLKDSGSTYRVNGKEVKAKEIQFLFADLSTGSRSCNIIDQGSVGNLMTLKPIERRKILDEAAGISGITARKLESSNKLDATKRNLQRLADILRDQKIRLEDLNKQASKAKIYKNSNERILNLNKQISLAKLTNSKKQLNNIMRQHNIEKDLLQNKSSFLLELESSISLENIEKQKLEKQINSYTQNNLLLELKIEKFKYQISNNTQELNSLNNLEGQIEKNIVFQKDILVNAEARVNKLNQEINLANNSTDNTSLKDLEKELKNQESILADKKQLLNDLNSKLVLKKDSVNKSEYDLNAINKNILLTKTEATNIEKSLIKKINEKTNFQNNKDIDIKLINNKKKIKELENVHNINLKYLSDINQDITNLNINFEKNIKQISSQKELINKIERRLSSYLSLGFQNTKENILKRVSIKNGYELAFYLALGDGIEASKSIEASVAWYNFSKNNLPTVPSNLETLSKYVKGPKELNNFLSQVAIVKSLDAGNKIHSSLENGQIAISKNGALWRWDGLFIKDGKKTITYKRIMSTTEILKLEKELSAENSNFMALKKTNTIIESNLRNKKNKLYVMKEKIKKIEVDIQKHKEYKNNLDRQQFLNTSLLETHKKDINEQEHLLKIKHDEQLKLENHIKDLLKTITKESGMIVEIKKLSSSKSKEIDEIKKSFDKMQISYALLKQNYDTSQMKEKKIFEEIKVTSKQMENTRIIIDSLNKDKTEVNNKIKINITRPDALNKDISNITNNIKNNKNDIEALNNTLEKINASLEISNTKCSKLKIKIQELNESCIRKETKIEELEGFLKIELNRIKSETGEDITIFEGNFKSTENTLFDIKANELEVKKLKLKIDSIGNVNLSAEEELKKLTTKLEEVLTEENDLIKAAKKLEKAVEELNKEARTRIKSTFTEINNTFSMLFKKLFDGGIAYLELIDSNDPLEAGLELMVSPPGKKLQRLSLLSGGEKALSSLALIFSTFINKTSPICILDEVDAPLDDSNVEKFCQLLKEASGLTKQRFLVVTHNKITMSHMNKIYGITMMEPGVSKLVSVNIDKAESVYAAE